MTIFMWLFLLWLGFGFVHGGERETGGGGGRKIEAIIFFWSYILVDNKYYFTE